MPPGGGSAWHHSSDSYQMLDDSGAVWGMANMPLDRGNLTLTLRSSHSHHDFFYVLAVAAEQDGSASAPVVATVLARPGDVTVLDGRALARLHLRVGGEPDPTWPAAAERGSIGRGGVAVATFCIPSGPDTPMRITAVSLP